MFMRKSLPLISIIVPVYNAEKYLNRSLKSIIEQTYLNLEIILIDDGSTDNSGKICDYYAEKDNRIIVIHNENKGVSTSRNCGLNRANGEWVGFVDADDYIEKDMYEILYNNAIKYETDISVCNFYPVFDNSNRKVLDNTLQEIKVFNKQESIKHMFIHNSGYSAVIWNKLYKKDLINHFNEEISIGEDLLFNFKILKFVTRTVFDFRKKYVYRVRLNSASHSQYFNEKNLDELRVWSYIVKEVEEDNLDNDIKEIANYFKKRTMLDILLRLSLTKDENNLLLFKKIKEDYEKIKIVKIKNWKDCVKMLIIKCPYNFVGILWKFILKLQYRKNLL